MDSNSETHTVKEANTADAGRQRFGDLDVKTKTDRDLSLSWKDTSGYFRKFGISGGNTSNTVLTWIVLCVLAVIFGAVGCLLILYLPKPDHVEKEPSRIVTENMSLRLSRSFDIKMVPEAVASGRDLTFFVLSKGEIVHFDGDGKKIRTWKTEDPAGNLPCALTYIYTEAKGAGGTRFSALYIARGNKVYILDPELAEDPVHFLTLDNGALINSMRISDSFLFMTDAAKKLIYRYDLSSGDQEKIVLGMPDNKTHFPGFGPSSDIMLDLAIFPLSDLLFVTNPLLFRLEAFDIKTGQWRSEMSWGKHPGEENGFSGKMNPIHIDSCGKNRIVTVEYGVPGKIKIFTSQGIFLTAFVPFEKKKIANAAGFPKILAWPNGSIAVFSQNGDLEIYE